MKNLMEHTIQHRCSIDLSTIPGYNFVPNIGLTLPFVLNRKVEWDGNSLLQHPLFEVNKNGVWHLMLFQVRGVSFYLTFMFCTSKKSFIIYILIGDTVEVADTFKAKIILRKEDVTTPDKIVFYVKVVSVEDMKNVDGPLPNSHYLVLPYKEASRFFTIRKNELSFRYPRENGKWTLQLPITIKDIIEENPLT